MTSLELLLLLLLPLLLLCAFPAIISLTEFAIFVVVAIGLRDTFNILSAVVAPLCNIISIIFSSSSLSSSSGGFFGGGSGGLLLSSIVVKADTIASRWFFSVSVACVVVGSFLLYVLCQKFLSIILNILSWFSLTLSLKRFKCRI